MKQIDPLFSDHPFFAEQRQRTSEFIETLKREQAVEAIKSLQGAALDAKLRELGFDPDQLLKDSDEAMASALLLQEQS